MPGGPWPAAAGDSLPAASRAPSPASTAAPCTRRRECCRRRARLRGARRRRRRCPWPCRGCPGPRRREERQRPQSPGWYILKLLRTRLHRDKQGWPGSALGRRQRAPGSPCRRTDNGRRVTSMGADDGPWLLRESVGRGLVCGSRPVYFLVSGFMYGAVGP